MGRAHGLDGSFFVDGASDDPKRFARGAELYAAGERATIVASKRGSGGRPVIRLDRPVERGAPLELDRSELPEPEPGAYYVFQLIGLRVREEAGPLLGTVTEVHPGPANDSLELDSGLLLPLVDECVLSVDLDSEVILVARGFGAPG